MESRSNSPPSSARKSRSQKKVRAEDVEAEEQNRIFQEIIKPPVVKEIETTSFDSLSSYRLKLADKLGITSTSIGLSSELLFETPWQWTGIYFYPLTLFFKNPEYVQNYASVLFDRKNAEELLPDIVYLKLYLNPDLESEYIRDSAAYENWVRDFEERRAREEKYLEDIQKIENQLEAIRPANNTDPISYKQKQRFEPKIRRPSGDVIDVDASDWIEIIDKAVPSREVPVIFAGPADNEISYSIKGFSVFREKEGQFIESGLLWDQYKDLQTLPLSFMSNLPTSGEKYNYLFRIAEPLPQKMISPMYRAMTVRFTYVNVIALINAGTHIYKMTYIIAPGEKRAESQNGMTIVFPPEATGMSSGSILKYLEKAFPNLDFGKGKNISTSAIFQIEGIDLNWALFLDMIRRDPLISQYLTVKSERRLAFPSRAKMYVIFTHPMDRTLPESIRNNEWIELNINAIPSADKKLSSVEVIATFDRQEQLEVLIPVLTRLLKYYEKNKKKYEAQLLQFMTSIPVSKVREKTRQKGLLTSHPLFDASYQDLIPKYRRVEIVTDPTQKKKAHVLYNGSEKVFHFKCLSEEYSVSDTIRNPDYDGTNYQNFPYCRHPEEKKDAIPLLDQATTEIESDTQMNLNRIGKVNDSLRAVLENISTSEFKRAGNIAGYNSLLGCILKAMNDESLSKDNLLNPKRGPIARIRQLRKEIAQSINPLVCIQENTDLTEQEIQANLENFDSPLESKRYYRALEEFFQIHIFIFQTVEVEAAKMISEFEIPFSKYFSLRRFDLTRPSIMIQRIRHSKNEGEGEPQYQLLMMAEDINRTQRVFEPSVTAILANLYSRSYSVYIRDQALHKLPLNLDALSLLKKEFGITSRPTAQIIDEAGKCRGLVFDTWSVLFAPTMPYELPRGEIKPFRRRNNKNPEGKFTTPSAKSTSGNMIIGLWFSIGLISDYFFLPLSPIEDYPEIENLNNLPTLWKPALQDEQEMFENNLKSLRIVYHVLRWFVAILGGSSEALRKISKLSFISAKVNYSFNLPRLFPEVNSLDEALDYVIANSKGFITSRPDPRITLPSEKILTYLEKSLWRVKPAWRFRASDNSTEIKLPRMIPNYYVYRNDFRPGLIFGSQELDSHVSMDSNMEAKNALSNPKFPTFLTWDGQVFLYKPYSSEGKSRENSYRERVAETARLFKEIRGVDVPLDRVFIFGLDTHPPRLIPLENKTGYSSGEVIDYLPIIDEGILVPLL